MLSCHSKCRFYLSEILCLTYPAVALRIFANRSPSPQRCVSTVFSAATFSSRFGSDSFSAAPLVSVSFKLDSCGIDRGCLKSLICDVVADVSNSSSTLRHWRVHNAHLQVSPAIFCIIKVASDIWKQMMHIRACLRAALICFQTYITVLHQNEAAVTQLSCLNLQKDIILVSRETQGLRSTTQLSFLTYARTMPLKCIPFVQIKLLP